MPSVLIPLAPGFEEIEAVTLSDVFRRAAMTVVMAATLENPVRASRDVVVVADTMLDSALDRDYDLVVLQAAAKALIILPAIHASLTFYKNKPKKTAGSVPFAQRPRYCSKQAFLKVKKLRLSRAF